MYNKKKVAKKYLLIVIIIIFLLGFIYLDKKRTNYFFFEKIIKNTVSQVENFLIPKVKVDYSNIVSGINRELEDENKELKKMLLLDSTDYQFIHADVIERNDLWYQEIKINKGSNDGIKTNMAVIANDGVTPWSNEVLMSRDICRIVKTIMVTCGMYDASGEFAIHVGIPAKSGVGGGVLATVPRRYGIGLYGPALDAKGNSVCGLRILKDLSEEFDLSIF